MSVHKPVSDNNVFAEFHPDFFCVKDKATKRVLLHGTSRNGLYPVSCSSPSSAPLHCQGLAATTTSLDLWHRRIGHPSSSIVDYVTRSNKLACTPRTNKNNVCDSCQQAKIHQLPFRLSTHVTSSPLELIHSDVWGPAITSVGGFKYYVSFLDDYSRYTWIYLIKQKSDVENAFFLFQKHTERLLNSKIHAFSVRLGRRVSSTFTIF